jgi:His/Glu/Gln/Arg/opine family amino acid ABC transporter permease subunit
MKFSINFLPALELYLQRLPLALVTTLGVTAGALVIGLVLGLVLAVGRLSPVRWISWPAQALIKVMRATPVPPFLYLVYFAILGLVFPIKPTEAGTLALGILVAPYMAELFRSGMQSVPKGQVEAGLTLGMSSALVNRRIVVPLAVRIMLPALGQATVAILLDSAAIAVLGSREITGISRNIINGMFTPELYFVVAATYFVIAFPMSRLFTSAERRLKLNL